MANSTVGNFKKKAAQRILLPSGEEVLCKRGGIETFIRSGKVPNSLMPMMKAAMTGKKVDVSNDLDLNEETLTELFEMFDLVCLTVFIDPRCHSVPMVDDGNGHMVEGTRDEDLLYVDEVGLEDKQFLFQWAVGGTSDVETFRVRSQEYMASLQSGKAVSSPAVLPPPPPE